MPDTPDKLQSHLPMFVLDVLRWVDSYDSILNVINNDQSRGWRKFWQQPFEPKEINNALLELQARGLIEEHQESSDYYAITPTGRRKWEQWIPPGDAGVRVVISRILRSWDPIGVFDIDSDWPQDEYESYVPRIIESLHRGVGEEGISALLQNFRVESMGLPPNPQNDFLIARDICAAWSELHAT